MLIYIEFISRRPGVSIEAFHKVAGRGQAGWAEEHGADDLLLSLGRTWRIGPEPEYLAIWWSREHGLERFDEWEAEFRSGAADHVEQPFALAARIDRAGCYVPLLDPVAGGQRERYFAEYFDRSPDTTTEEVTEHFVRRAAAYPQLQLHLVAERIGMLGPGSPVLAIWSADTWGDLEMIARDVTASADPVRLTDVAFYSSFGYETL